MVLAPLALAAVWLGGWAFAGFVAVAAGILVWEWSGVSRSRQMDGAVVAVIAVVGAVVALVIGWPYAALAILAIGVGGAQALAWASDPARLMWLGVVYAGLPALALVVLRADPNLGLFAVVWLLALVWATDIGAYVFGRMIGGPKLAPRISPAKTWAGFLGGIAAALAVGLVVVRLAGEAASPPVWLPVALSIASQAGDLVESAFKRRFGAKDSSRLIPGHGGLMDRVDGLVAAAVVAAAIGVARGGLEAAGSGLLVW